jgi:hypothetical protein
LINKTFASSHPAKIKVIKINIANFLYCFQIRTVLSALIGAIPGVFYTIVFCLLFWCVLAILGTQLFSGKFGR